MFAVSTRAIGFFFRIFLSRILGPEMLGVYQIAMGFFMVFLTIIASGIPLAVSKEVAKITTTHGCGGKGCGENERVTGLTTNASRSIGRITVAGLSISLIVSVVLCVVVWLLRDFAGVIFTDERCMKILLIMLPSIIACSVYTALRAVWWGEKKFFLLGATELLEQILRVVFFIILIGFSGALMDAAGLAGLSFTIACVVSAVAVVIIHIRTRRKMRLSSTHPGSQSSRYVFKVAKDSASESFAKPILKSASPITGVRVIGSIAMPVISVIIPLRLVAAGWTSVQAISHFGMVVGMTFPLLTMPSTIISALSTALVPELSGAMQRKDMATVSKQVKGALTFTLFITFAVLPAFIALGQPIGEFLFASPMAGKYLSTAAWVMVPLALSQITTAILNSLGAEVKAMKHYVLGSIVLFAAVWFLPAIMGINALLVGMGLCMTIASILNVIMIAKLSGARMDMLKMILVFSAIGVPAMLLAGFTYGLVAHIWGLFMSLAIAGGLSVLLVLLLCRVFNVVDVRAVLRREKVAVA
jgi:stage V sporulation protein B